MGDVVGVGASTPVILPGELVQALRCDTKLPCKVCVVSQRAKLQKSLKLFKSLLGLIRLLFPGLQHKKG
jgi:hypothetical protein